MSSASSTEATRSWLGVWIPRLYLLSTLLLAPWTVFLALTLPRHAVTSHYRWTWVVFDALLCITLARIWWLSHRRNPRVALTASAGAALLVADAWFDVSSAHGSDDHLQAVVMAVFVELPGACLCVLIANRALKHIAKHGLSHHQSDEHASDEESNIDQSLLPR